MCDEDYDSVRELTSCWRKARKAHDCYACCETIRAGDKYHATVQKYDGELFDLKHCARCYYMSQAILAAGAESVQWDLHCGVEWEEAFGEPPPDEVARLAFATADEMQARLK